MRLAALLLCFGMFLATDARAETGCGTPAALADGWQVATPESADMYPDLLCQLVHRFADWKEMNVHAILVARHDKLVFEQYFTGKDDAWGKPLGEVAFGPDSKHDLRSITKSVVALLLGVAIEHGWVKGVDTPVLDLLPQYADLRTPEKERITIRDLLTMSAGFAWNENLPYGDPANSETQMDRAADPCRYVLEQRVANTPGVVWNYTGGAAALISCVLQKASGQPLDVLAQTLLFAPLDIQDAEWARYPVTGGPVAASGLRMRPRDIVKIGQLVLDKGRWQGKQIVPADWVAAATTPQINGLGVWFYGYQFWLGRSLVHGHEVDWAAGVGYGGQRLFIVPTLDLVVLVNAGLYGQDGQDWIGTVALNRFILPATRP